MGFVDNSVSVNLGAGSVDTMTLERPPMASEKPKKGDTPSAARQEGSSTRIHDDVLQMARVLIGMMPKDERTTMIDLLSDILRPELQKRLKAKQDIFGEIASGGPKPKSKKEK
jgi:hypothetical protein